MAEETSSPPTKWNFDEDRMKAISAYLIFAEDAFSNFTSYNGMMPIEILYGRLATIKRAILGTGTKGDDKLLKDKFKELEKIKRKCNDLFLYEIERENGIKKFVPASIEFLNKAEETYEGIQKICTKNGFYLRRSEDPRRAIEM